MNIMVFIVIFLSATFAFGHGGEKHEKKQGELSEAEKISNDERAAKKEVFEEINFEYQAKIKPIFKRSCFDCHSNQTKFPWYYKLPGAKQLIDSDIKEAKEHLDFTNDFPFVSHDTPAKDLESISESISENKMPPFKYRIMHSESSLSDEDKKIINGWVKKSLEKLK